MCSDPCYTNGPSWSHETALAFSYMGDKEGTDFTLLTASLIGQGNSNCSWGGGGERQCGFLRYKLPVTVMRA